MNLTERKSWDSFRDTGLLWWINRTLHLFGWAIIFDYEKDLATGQKKLVDVYPARCHYRGFSTQDDTNGFIVLSKYCRENNLDIFSINSGEDNDASEAV